MLLGLQALERFISDYQTRTVLDLGSGEGEHSALLRASGKEVTTISLIPPADIVGDYLETAFGEPFDAIWASHVLEHQPNVNLFLKKCFADLHDMGVLAVTVPPLKHEVVGGHVNLFNAGTLLYNLIMAGFDCSEARVGCYGYNVSVLVQKKKADLPDLVFDNGDIETLAPFFPMRVAQNFNGKNLQINW